MEHLTERAIERIQRNNPVFFQGITRTFDKAFLVERTFYGQAVKLRITFEDLGNSIKKEFIKLFR